MKQKFSFSIILSLSAIIFFSLCMTSCGNSGNSNNVATAKPGDTPTTSQSNSAMAMGIDDSLPDTSNIKANITVNDVLLNVQQLKDIFRSDDDMVMAFVSTNASGNSSITLKSIRGGNINDIPIPATGASTSLTNVKPRANIFSRDQVKEFINALRTENPTLFDVMNAPDNSFKIKIHLIEGRDSENIRCTRFEISAVRSGTESATKRKTNPCPPCN